MAKEYQLSYTASDIDERLGKIPAIVESTEKLEQRVASAVTYTPQTLTEEQKAHARENIGITNDPNIHAKYFTITDDGIVSLKPEYRGACPSNRASAFPMAVSDNGVGAHGSNSAELPEMLVIPEVVNEIAVVGLAPGMFLQNHAVVNVTLPAIVFSIPDRFCDNAWKLRIVNNTEQILTIGTSAFQKSHIEKAIFPNLTSLGNNAFVYCAFLVYADIGKVTKIGDYAFFMCTRLSRLKGGAEATSIGTVAFSKNYRLYNVDSFAKVKSIGQNAFMRCRLNYDWQSLKNNGCTFGTDATSLQLNPTDFWSSCTPTACENPVPTLLSQLDARWDKRVIANGLDYANHGCAWMTIMHIYCALNNLTLTHVEQFEAICNSINPNIIGKFDRTAEKSVEILQDLGLNAELVNIKTSNAQTNLQKIYNAVANGSYVHGLLGGAVNNSPFGYHAAMIYGVNAKGELLYADSSDQAAVEMTNGTSVIKYPMPIQNSIQFDDSYVQQFIIVSKA